MGVQTVITQIIYLQIVLLLLVTILGAFSQTMTRSVASVEKLWGAIAKQGHGNIQILQEMIIIRIFLIMKKISFIQLGLIMRTLPTKYGATK